MCEKLPKSADYIPIWIIQEPVSNTYIQGIYKPETVDALIEKHRTENSVGVWRPTKAAWEKIYAFFNWCL